MDEVERLQECLKDLPFAVCGYTFENYSERNRQQYDAVCMTIKRFVTVILAGATADNMAEKVRELGY